MAKNYFPILEVTSSATPDEVHSAYRRLAKEFHPDHYEGSSKPFRQIQEAYSVPGNPAKRKAQVIVQNPERFKILHLRSR